MNRTHVDLTDDQHEQLHEVARRRGRSLNEVVHEAIELFLDEVAPEPESSAGEDTGEVTSARDRPSQRTDRSA